MLIIVRSDKCEKLYGAFRFAGNRHEPFNLSRLHISIISNVSENSGMLKNDVHMMMYNLRTKNRKGRESVCNRNEIAIRMSLLA